MKIVFLEPLGISNDLLLDMARNALGDAVELVAYPDRKEDEATLIQRSAGADIVVLSNFPYRKSVISQLPDLKMICVAFTGTDHVDVDYCHARGIAVCNCAGYSTVAVADLVFGFVIDLARNILPCDAACRKEGTKAGLVGFELEGKTFGIVGAGAIGLRVARIANAFGCRVLAWSRTKKEVPGVTFVDSLEELLPQCDIVSLHVPQTPATVGLIGAKELKLMKPTALLINTARGPVVDSAALAAALQAGEIAGAGIDVFEMEPPVPADHPLLHAPHVVATPHVAFASQQAFQKRAVIVVENLKQFLAGKPQNLV